VCSSPSSSPAPRRSRASSACAWSRSRSAALGPGPQVVSGLDERGRARIQDGSQVLPLSLGVGACLAELVSGFVPGAGLGGPSVIGAGFGGRRTPFCGF